jgi:hypothetical protein
MISIGNLIIIFGLGGICALMIVAGIIYMVDKQNKYKKKK